MNRSESKYFNTATKMDDALIALLEKKSFEFITIKDVCRKANVNRSTFYLHYLSLNDLLEEVMVNMNKSFAAKLNLQQSKDSILNTNNLNDLYLINDNFLFPYLTFIKENKNTYRAISDNPSLFKVDNIYNNMFTNIFSPILTRFNLDVKWHKYIMDFYIQGISATILDWVKDDCKIEITEVAHFIEMLIVKYDNTKN